MKMEEPSGTVCKPVGSSFDATSAPTSAIGSSSSSSKVNNPKIVIQHRHHHVLLEPFYGPFSTDGDGCGNVEMGSGGSSAAGGDCSSSASSTTSGSEFDEIPTSGINYCRTRGGHDNLPISTLLSVNKFKENSLKKFKGSEVIFRGGVIIRGESRQRANSDSSTLVSPSVILTGEDEDEDDVDGNGTGRNEGRKLSKTSSEADSSTDVDSQQLQDQRRQSLKHLSVSAPAMRTSSTKSGDGSDTGLPPMTTSKSRQKKFHRHFKTVPPDEKVLDYYSCALVADILLQGFLYITENYFAFYSNVFGYVTKVLIPVCSVVRITKERTAKIFPNAVGVCTRTEKHVFASLISRDTTFKLMCKVWNYSIEQEAEEIRALQRRVAAQVEAEDAFSADVPVPDESSGDSGSGNDSAIEPSSHSPSPQNTPGIEKLIHAKSTITAIPSHLAGAAAVAVVTHGEEKSITLAGGKLVEESTVPILTYRGTHHIRASISNANTNPNLHSTSSNAHHHRSQQQAGRFSVVRKLGSNVGGRGPSLLLVATALLVILFMSAALLLSRISSLQQKLMERPVIHDSEQFYQELLSWQTKLHSTTGEEIHQYINSNLQQIVKVRESLEALSMLFVNRPQGAPGLGEPHPSTIMGGEGDHHHHHHHPHQDS